MLAHVCANVTSIFHRQPPFLFPDPLALYSKITAGLTGCHDTAEGGQANSLHGKKKKKQVPASVAAHAASCVRPSGAEVHICSQ